MGDPNTGEIYQGRLRESKDIGLSPEVAQNLANEADVKKRMKALQDLIAAREQAKPDLRTLEGVLSFLDYHTPNEDTLPRYQQVNTAFQALMSAIWNVIPDGPGKTVAIRAIGRARMECNSCIANGGQ